MLLCFPIYKTVFKYKQEYTHINGLEPLDHLHIFAVFFLRWTQMINSLDLEKLLTGWYVCGLAPER